MLIYLFMMIGCFVLWLVSFIDKPCWPMLWLAALFGVIYLILNM